MCRSRATLRLFDNSVGQYGAFENFAGRSESAGVWAIFYGACGGFKRLTASFPSVLLLLCAFVNAPISAHALEALEAVMNAVHTVSVPKRCRRSKSSRFIAFYILRSRKSRAIFSACSVCVLHVVVKFYRPVHRPWAKHTGKYNILSLKRKREREKGIYAHTHTHKIVL